MADAARSARSAFADIKSSSKEGGEAVQKSAINAQSAIGVLTNALRGDVESAFADVIREMSHTSVVMAALPFAAAAGGALLLVGVVNEVATKVKEWREEQEKLRLEQTRFGTVVNETYNSLDDRILQAGQRADELKNNHLGALAKALELIDHQSMADLVKEFETVSKAAESTFKLLEGHWYTFGIGSAGANHALELFKTNYDSLLAQGKSGDATNLLSGTLKTAKDILAAQQQAKANSGITTNNPTDTQRVTNAFQEAYVKLKAAGVQYSDKEIESQKTLIQTLEAQVGIEQRSAELRKLDKGNAKTQTGNDASALASAAARTAAQNQMAIAEQQLASDKAFADARLSLQQASIEQRLQSDISFAERDRQIKLQANQAEISALDKAGKDYSNNLKALRDQQGAIEATAATAIAQLKSKAQVAQNQKDLADLQQAEREQINATQQGSAERLAIIDAAMKDAESKNLQETDFYKQLRTARVDTVRQGAEQESQAKLQGIQIQTKGDEQSLQSQIRLATEELASRSASIQEQTALAVAGEDAMFGVERDGLQQQLEALQESGVAKVAEVQRVQEQIEALNREHETRKFEIQAQGARRQADSFNGALQHMESGAAQSAFRILSGQQSFVSVMGGLINQLSQNLIQSVLERQNVQRVEQLGNAKSAAGNTYAEVSKWPVVGPILAPIAADGAFAAVMAFNSGTDGVPGVGNRDTVPAMLTPGEGVVPGGVMDGLRKMANNGGFEGGGQTVHVHVRPVYHLQALDGKGIDRTLKNHTSTLTKHFNQQVRRMNK
jgi:uncharacterized protein YdcH (DUF465 family)